MVDLYQIVVGRSTPKEGAECTVRGCADVSHAFSETLGLIGWELVPRIGIKGHGYLGIKRLK